MRMAKRWNTVKLACGCDRMFASLHGRDRLEVVEPRGPGAVLLIGTDLARLVPDLDYEGAGGGGPIEYHLGARLRRLYEAGGRVEVDHALPPLERRWLFLCANRACRHVTALRWSELADRFAAGVRARRRAVSGAPF